MKESGCQDALIERERRLLEIDRSVTIRGMKLEGGLGSEDPYDITR